MTSPLSPIIVDMFCGAGGESCGIKQAADAANLDISMYAINHWEQAIETHQANFPAAEHICRDIQDINPSDIIPHNGNFIDLLQAFQSMGYHLQQDLAIIEFFEPRLKQHLLIKQGFISLQKITLYSGYLSLGETASGVIKSWKNMEGEK